MLCTNCSKNTATTHITKSINGVTKEYHLCSECADKLGFTDEFSSFSPFSDFNTFSPTNIFASLLGMTPTLTGKVANSKKCSGCGSTFEEIIQTGKAGCAKCYDEFGDRLNISIEKIHGVSSHCGKTPNEENPEIKKKKELNSLKEELSICIEKQEFEKAAELRDKIKEIEGGSNND